MSTIPADDRCRKFADYIVDHYIDLIPDLWASGPQQSPTITNATKSFHSHMNADIRTPQPNVYVFVQYIQLYSSQYCLLYTSDAADE